MSPCNVYNWLVAVSVLFFFVPAASSLSFNLSSFDSTTMKYVGDAVFSSQGIDLTKSRIGQNLGHSTGRAVYYEPLQLWDKVSSQAANFITHFTFMINNQSLNNNGDGLAFFMAPYPANQIPSNSGGGGLGIFNTSASQVIAVEFDTYLNPTFDPPFSSHMGIDINSILSVNVTDLGVNLLTPYLGHATIHYNASNMTLSASLRYPDDPQLSRTIWNISYAIDLRNYLPEQVAIGFSAATGDSNELHIIKSWDFNSTELITLAPFEKRNENRWILQVVVNVVGLLGLGFIFFLVRCCRKRKMKKNEYVRAQELPNIDNVFDQSGRAPKKFGYEELVTATRNFSNEEKLGEGGFGEVYRGVVDKMNGLQVAIKRISKGSRQGIKEYMAEVTIISQLRHRHLVQLIGYCHEKGEFLLVYEYMSNKSLDAHLYNKHTILGSLERYKIALDLASALMYLHEGWEHGVVHRDIKPSNVMLDSDFSAKLGDFGMAKLVEHDQSMLATVLAGTRGYMAPEYMETGKAGKECDVYSFGILAMELACGRKPIDLSEKEGHVRLVDWVWELYQKQKCGEAVDKQLNMELNDGRMEHLMVVGLWCAHQDYKLRPTIRQAFCVLNYDAMLPKLPPQVIRQDYSSSSTAGTSSFTGGSYSNESEVWILASR